jgi:hypothetical protein
MTAQAKIQNQNLPAQKSNNAMDKTIKPMTDAMQKADSYRDAMNAGREKIMADDYSCVVYCFSDRLNRPCAVGYRGRALKTAFNYYYSNSERRDTLIKEWMDSVTGSTRSKRDTQERVLVVGDVLVSSWGYEQTNIDYYLVTELVGKASVMIVEIGKIKTYDGQDYGRCTPDTQNIIGCPMKKRVRGNSVKITSYSSARKLAKENGRFPAFYWSSYY